MRGTNAGEPSAWRKVRALWQPTPYLPLRNLANILNLMPYSFQADVQLALGVQW